MAEVSNWRKSSRSNGGADSNCVEARQSATGFQVRDSKLGHDSPVFDLGAADLVGLLQAAARSLGFATPPRTFRKAGPLSGEPAFSVS